jgi:hypothetical protein
MIIRTRRRLWVGLWIGLVFAMVLMLSACAGGADKGAAKAPTAKAHSANAHMAKSHTDDAHTDAANSAKTRPLPDPGTPPTPTNLTPGRYVTNEFEPSVALSVGKGWAINNPEKTDHFSIYNRDFAKSDKEAGPSSPSSTSGRSSILRGRQRATSAQPRKIYSHGSNSTQDWTSRNRCPQP